MKGAMMNKRANIASKRAATRAVKQEKNKNRHCAFILYHRMSWQAFCTVHVYQDGICLGIKGLITGPNRLLYSPLDSLVAFCQSTSVKGDPSSDTQEPNGKRLVGPLTHLGHDGWSDPSGKCKATRGQRRDNKHSGKEPEGSRGSREVRMRFTVREGAKDETIIFFIVNRNKNTHNN